MHIIEGFFVTLKKELVHRENYHTREQAKASLFSYIEVFYNRRRRRSALGLLGPHDYEQTLLSRLSTSAGKSSNSVRLLRGQKERLDDGLVILRK